MKKNSLNTSKRYLVTYTDGSISSTEASNILGVAQENCKEGVSFLASDAIPDPSDVLHFEQLGVSAIALSEEEAEKLVLNEKVLAVEEDIEVFALGMESNFSENDYSMGSDIMTQENQYGLGYKKAIVDMFSSLLDASFAKAENADTSSLISRPIFPIFPRPPFTPIPFQPIPWNINLVKAPQAWARGIRGTGIKVAVLDTGIAAHPDLVISGGASFIPGVVSFNDGHGHGTHCAGVIGARNNFIGVVGVAPQCNLYGVKVLSDAGSGQMSWIIAGMEWCINNGMKVANMSLGSSSAPSVAYANAIKRCQDNGVTVVCAAGNSFGGPSPWVGAPANSILAGVPNASPIAVGAVDRNCLIAPFSSRGGNAPLWNQVTVVAPGVEINSTYLSNGYRVMQGTSMAAPHVAGLAALLCQRFPGITPLAIKSRIMATATDLGPVGNDITYGRGLINCNLATV